VRQLQHFLGSGLSLRRGENGRPRRGHGLGYQRGGWAAGPRFGTSAASGTNHDTQRVKVRRSEIDAQANGVAYGEPLRDHRWHRFGSSGPGGYDEEEADIWHAITQYKAGFNPATDERMETDRPEPEFREMWEELHGGRSAVWVDNMTVGFWRADASEEADAEALRKMPDEMCLAYHFRKHHNPDAIGLNAKEHETWRKLQAIWAKWEQMLGTNAPLERSKAGPQRDFDINLDGMAHYGMLPDLLQDICNTGLAAEDLTPLFRSAHDYIQMWDACEQRSHEIAASQKAKTQPSP